MPTKMTYGKRKKSILALLPGLMDGDKPTDSGKSKVEKRASATVSMTAFYGKNNNDSNHKNSLALDESIEEMSSMLIDDTTMNQLTGECGKRLSQLGSAKILPHLTRQDIFHDKALPRLLRLSFDEGNDGAPRPTPAITFVRAASKDVNSVDGQDGLDSFPPPVRRQPVHGRKSSAPSLPRKSSKRRPRQRESNEDFERNKIISNIGHQVDPQKLSQTMQQDLKASLDVSQQIEAMLGASKALKLEVDSPLTGWPGLTEKSTVMGNSVLSRMKSAITIHRYDKGHKKHYDHTNSDHLLDANQGRISDYDEETSAINAMELRINEGTNFGNPKIKSLTGHGTIRRKPIADDGRSLLSRISVEASSPQNTPTIGAKSLKNLDSRHHNSVSFDRSADIISKSPARLHRLKNQPRQLSNAMKGDSDVEVDFDALFSSSPVAQSTPRIRLEPVFPENGNKKLRHFPADLHSLFNTDNSLRERFSDVSTNTASLPDAIPKKLVTKRSNSQVKDIGLGVKSYVSKRRKKHPSPSNAELKGLEDALARYPLRTISVEQQTQEELTLSFGELRTGEALKSKDKNALLLQTAKRGEKGKRTEIFSRSEQAVGGPSMAVPARRPILKVLKQSMIPKPAGAPTMKRRMDVGRYHLMTQEDESALDTDELQWEATAYHIGMRS